jgi:hypothetical protein
MSGFQSFLVIGAMGLLAVISLNFNASVLQNSTVEIENKVYLTAFSLADDMIEEMKQKAFDHETVIFRSINPDELTPVNALGPDSGETSSIYYNDIDDFNGYSKQVSLPHAEGYSVNCKVQYAQANDPDNVSNTQTYYKLVVITVQSKYLSNPVKLRFIFTLHSKVV